MYANEDRHGGKLIVEVKKELAHSNDVSIATGYVSHDVIRQFRNDFLRIVENRGRFRLLVGMAFFECMSARALRDLTDIESILSRAHNGSGVFVSYSRRFHGKIYRFESATRQRFFVGSSNFSRSGLEQNLECTVEVAQDEGKIEINRYLDYLFSPDNSVSIAKAEIAVPGSDEYKKRISLSDLSDLERFDPASIDRSQYQSFEYSLARIADKDKSSLNAYFGKGRLNRTTGKVTPRPWYEVELIANRAITSHPLYPKGEFMAYTDDGYVIPMVTNGDYYKNIRSRGNLSLLGQWIKGKLQKSGALITLTPVTHDTLDLYGNDSIRFYKISADRYFLEF